MHFIKVTPTRWEAIAAVEITTGPRGSPSLVVTTTGGTRRVLGHEETISWVRHLGEHTLDGHPALEAERRELAALMPQSEAA